MKSFIIPSLIASSKGELLKRFSHVSSSSNVFQLDVMDGSFVDSTSLLFDFNLDNSLKVIFEAHLMMDSPLSWIKEHESLLDLVILHVESKGFSEAFSYLSEKKISVGVALSPDTSVSSLESIDMSAVDTILVMTVYPGSYGASFLPEMVSKVSKLRSKYPKKHIEVDGSVNSETIESLSSAGANKFVVGSFLQNSSNPKKEVDSLKTLIKS